jgi:hypothetical protein
MNAERNALVTIGLSIAFFVACKSVPQSADRVELFRHPGLQWLSWTPAERESFVDGYIQGYGHGVVEACSAADDLFEKDKQRVFGHDNVPSTFPSARCHKSVAEYSNVKISLSTGPDFSSYTTVITEFYTKHPEYRDTPHTRLMKFLAGEKTLTADDLYLKLTTWKSQATPQ